MMIRLFFVAALGISSLGCRTLHENGLRNRVLEARFSLTQVDLTLNEVDSILRALPKDTGTCGSLCLVSVEPNTDESITWCLAIRGYRACFRGRASENGTKFKVLASPAPVGIVRALWQLTDPIRAQEALAAGSEDLSDLALAEEENFDPSFTFTAGLRSGMVSSLATSPAFTFGGHLGLRYWLNYFMIPGVAVSVENVVVTSSSFVTVAPQARLEFAVWSPQFERYLNLPRLTFLMGVEPIIAFGSTMAIGARGIVGVQLIHLGNLPSPFLFEVGYQSLTVGNLNASGVRVVLGIGI